MNENINEELNNLNIHLDEILEGFYVFLKREQNTERLKDLVPIIGDLQRLNTDYTALYLRAIGRGKNDHN